jgi:hypothetical protein
LKKLSVYLDQNAVSNLARATDWPKTELGGALLSPAIDVFVSPVHVLETMQAEEGVRAALAKTQLTLCAGRRMCPSYEFIVAEYFFDALEDAAPNAIKTREHFDYHKDSSIRIYLGALAILAQGLPANPSAVDTVRHAKLTNQVLHSRAAAAPREWLAALLDCTQNALVTSADPLAPFDALTAKDLQELVSNNSAEPSGLATDVRRKLQQHRAAIAAAYGAMETGSCLNAALPLAGELEAAFDATGVAMALRAWGVSQPLPTSAAPIPIRDLVQRAIFACVEKDILPARISHEVVLREIENASSAKETPNPGVVFDADHAIYLLHMNVFVTDDGSLLNALRPIAGRLSSPERPVEVCASRDFAKLAVKMSQ